jgi:hypothetical protein
LSIVLLDATAGVLHAEEEECVMFPEMNLRLSLISAAQVANAIAPGNAGLTVCATSHVRVLNTQIPLDVAERT